MGIWFWAGSVLVAEQFNLQGHGNTSQPLASPPTTVDKRDAHDVDGAHGGDGDVHAPPHQAHGGGHRGGVEGAVWLVVHPHAFSRSGGGPSPTAVKAHNLLRDDEASLPGSPRGSHRRARRGPYCGARAGLGFRVWDHDLGFRVQGLGFKV